jgi:hypothetical protein
MGTDRAAHDDTRKLLVGGSLAAALGLGWFMLSHVVKDTAAGDAVVEAFGVVLGLLVVASVIGAVRASLHDPDRRDDPRSG